MLECRVCGARGEHERFVAREMMFGRRDPFEYFACGSCGCLQIVEVPAGLSAHYPSDYYSFARPREGRVKRFLKRRRAVHLLEGRSAIGRVAARWFGVPDLFAWIAVTGVQPDDEILDVGSGGGHLLLQLRDIGFRRLTGIDPYLRTEAGPAEGVRLLRRRVEEVEGEFDLVMMHHAFEHVPDPRDVLAHVRRLLRPGAVALIRIPLADSWAWEHYRTDWVQLDAPRHLYLHTRRSMEILANQVGLRLERVIHDSTAFQFWGSEQYRRDIPLRDPRSHAVNPRASLFTREQIREFERRAGDLNAEGRGDQAAFYLRKARGVTGGNFEF
ncbi:MAG TPA: class I SAM-dependent methyltransferase [Longimicrobiaceae bacterium]